MNRLTRDELIHRALDMVDSPSLDQKDRPGDGGVLTGTAMSIGWLQEALDYFQRTFPWSSTIATASVTYGGATTTLPADYTLDVRNGFRILSSSGSAMARRLARKPLQYYLSCPPQQVGIPQLYMIQGTTVRFWPTPDRAYAGDFWYYQLPPILTARAVPAFPDDFVLIEYVRLRGKEWTGEAPPGSALEYGGMITAGLVKQGLGIEPESDIFDFDRTIYTPQGSNVDDPNAWMGPTVITP